MHHHAYIQHLKIKKACNLVDKDPNITFTEVADQCGFDAYPNFVRAFKNCLRRNSNRLSQKATSLINL